MIAWNIIRAHWLLRRAKFLLSCNSHDEALNDLQTIDDLYRLAPGTGLHKMAAEAKLQSGVLLEIQGRLDDASCTYDQVLIEFGSHSDPTVQRTVADALISKAETLRRRFHITEEMAVYDEIAQRFGCNPVLKEKAMWALAQKASRLGAQGLWDEEKETVEQLLRLLDAYPETVFANYAAWALMQKAMHCGNVDEELALYDRIVRDFGNVRSDEVMERVAGALLNKAHLLNVRNECAEAIMICDDLTNRCGDTTSERIRQIVVHGLVIKVEALYRLSQNDSALELCNQLITQFDKDRGIDINGCIARIHWIKAKVLFASQRFCEGIDACDSLISEFAGSSDTILRWHVARALFDKANALADQEQVAESLAVYNQVTTWFANAKEPSIQETVAFALVCWAEILYELHRYEEAIAKYDAFLSHFGRASDPMMREMAAGSLCNKAYILEEIGRAPESANIYQNVLSEFSTDQSPRIREAVSIAQDRMGANMSESQVDQRKPSPFN